jgi:hypothetical protein
MQGCATVNLTPGPTRLVFPQATPDTLPDSPPGFRATTVMSALMREAALNYLTPSGRYWEELDRFDPAELAALDAIWLRAPADRS